MYALKATEKERVAAEPQPVDATSFEAYANKFYGEAYAGIKDKVTYRQILDRLIATWKGKRLNEITRTDVKAFADNRRIWRNHQTVNRDVAVIRRLFEFAMDEDKPLITINPARKGKRLPAYTGRKFKGYYISPQQRPLLFAVLPDWLRPVVTFALETAGRKGDFLRLRWSDVDFREGFINFRDAKNGEDDDIAMTAGARAVLESLPHDNKLVFGGLCKYAIHKAWVRACRACNFTRPCEDKVSDVDNSIIHSAGLQR